MNIRYNVLLFYIILWIYSDIIQIHYYLPRNIKYSNKNFVILIPYEKVMPILVNLFNPQRCPNISPPQSFALFSKIYEIPKRDLIDEEMKCLIFYLYSSWRKVSTSNWADMQFEITNN